MRKNLALTVVALTLVGLTACSTKSNSNNSGPSGTSSTPASTKLGQGVTADSIKLGITYVDLAAIRNVVNIDQGDYQKAFNAVINNVNANGGVNGRKIVPVYAAVNPLGTAPAAAACTKLTEDDKVFAVVGFFQQPDTVCYVKTHDTPIVGVSLTPEQAAAAKQPAFDMVLSPEHLADKSIPAIAKQGAFTGHKVAVVGATADQTVMNNTVIPDLKKAGADVVATAINDAPTTDVPAGYAKYGLIAQKFQSAGADVVRCRRDRRSGLAALASGEPQHLPAAPGRDRLAAAVGVHLRQGGLPGVDHQERSWRCSRAGRCRYLERAEYAEVRRSGEERESWREHQ